MLFELAQRGRRPDRDLPEIHAYGASDRILRDAGLAPQTLPQPARAELSWPGESLGTGAILRRAVRALARLGRRFAALLRARFEAALTAWRHHREFNALLHDGGRTARDIGLNHGEIVAVVARWPWSPKAKQLREAAARRRDDAIVAASACRAPGDPLPAVAAPPLSPSPSADQFH